MTPTKKIFDIKLIPASIWAIGIVTLLMNMSSIVVFSLSPIYLTSVLGVNHFELGFLEGIMEALACFTRIFSGVISDFWRQRKPLLFLASGLAACSRPLFAWAPTLGWVMTARSLDRISNGLQATPREALVGDHAPKELKGTCYGLRQTLSVAGSMLGAIGVYFLIQDQSVDYRTIFWLASLPPLIALVVLYFFVKDIPATAIKNHKNNFIASIVHIKDLKTQYWTVLLVASIFTLSSYSGAFMILQAKETTQSITIGPLTMIFQNLATVIAAYPIGRLSDQMDRRKLLALGFIITICSNFILAYAASTFMVLLGAFLWGIQIGATQSLFVVKVADHAQSDLRGTAFGLYYFCIGISAFLGNLLIGWVINKYIPAYGFMVSSGFAMLALLSLPLIKKPSKLLVPQLEKE